MAKKWLEGDTRVDSNGNGRRPEKFNDPYVEQINKLLKLRYIGSSRNALNFVFSTLRDSKM